MILPASQEEGKAIKKRYAVLVDMDNKPEELKGFELKYFLAGDTLTGDMLALNFDPLEDLAVTLEDPGGPCGSSRASPTATSTAATRSTTTPWRTPEDPGGPCGSTPRSCARSLLAGAFPLRGPFFVLFRCFKFCHPGQAANVFGTCQELNPQISCINGERSETETDVDCGGTQCLIVGNACSDGSACNSTADCTTSSPATTTPASRPTTP